jgi:hypothetical protein
LKVSLRDDRMLPDIALVDPSLADVLPRYVPLASGLDALRQVYDTRCFCPCIGVITEISHARPRYYGTLRIYPLPRR